MFQIPTDRRLTVVLYYEEEAAPDTPPLAVRASERPPDPRPPRKVGPQKVPPVHVRRVVLLTLSVRVLEPFNCNELHQVGFFFAYAIFFYYEYNNTLF